MKASILAVTCWIIGAVLASADSPSSGSPVVLKGVTLDEVIHYLRINCGIKIAYVQSSADVTPSKTFEDILSDLTAIPSKERTSLQAAQIAGFQDLLKKYPQQATHLTPCPPAHDIIIPPGLVSRGLSGEQLNNVLESVVAKFTGYAYRKSNTLFLIYPKDDALNGVSVDFQLNNATQADAFAELYSIFERYKISRRLDPPGKDQIAPHPITLNLHHASVIELLCRFSECLGPRYSFDMRGSPPQTGARVMAFFPMPIPQ